jgi:hypothetical protein
VEIPLHHMVFGACHNLCHRGSRGDAFVDNHLIAQARQCPSEDRG